MKYFYVISLIIILSSCNVQYFMPLEDDPDLQVYGMEYRGGVATINIEGLPLESRNVQSMVYHDGNFFAATSAGLLKGNNSDGWSLIDSYRQFDLSDLNQVLVIDDNIFCTRISGGLYFSENQGLDWQLFEISDENGSYAPQVYSLLDTGAEIIAGSQNALFLTNDLGISWEKSEIDIFDSFPVRLLLAETDNFYVSDGRNLLFSQDKGRTWQRSGLFPLEIQGGFIFQQDLYLGSKEGLLFSDNQAKSWELRYLEAEAENYYLYSHDEAEFLAKFDNIPMRSLDGGLSWEALANAEDSFFTKITFFDKLADRYIAANAQLGLFEYQDSSWQALIPSSQYKLEFDTIRKIMMFKGNFFLMLSEGLVFSPQISTGWHWENPSAPETPVQLFSDNADRIWLTAIRDDNATAAYYSLDAGFNWVEQENKQLFPFNCFNQDELFIPIEGIIYSIDNLNRKLRWTSNQGINWQQINLPSLETTCLGVHERQIYLANYTGKLARSLDNGESWEFFKAPAIQGDRIYISQDILYTRGLNGLLVSFNQGESWSTFPAYLDSLFVQDGMVYLASQKGLHRYTLAPDFLP